MRWSSWIRRAHRWVSLFFSFAVALNFVAAAMGVEPPMWVYAFVLAPLFFLIVSGLFLFVLPYVNKRGDEPAGVEG